MKRSNSKWLPNSLAALCVLSFCLLAGFPAAAQKQTALKDAFKNDFLIGAALNPRQFFEQDQRGVEIVTTQFNTITPENVLKWALVHPEPARYDFKAADRFVEFGEKSRMFIVGHTLVWHNQTPRWVFQDEKGNALGRESLLQRLREHIFTVVGRYKGRIKGWDVVNEALNQDGTMRQSPWFKIIGEDYVAKAFEFAHEADPAAELYYNDYDLELPAKRAGAVALLKKLKENGVPIQAVGLQNHNLMDWPSAADEDATIAAFAALGLKVNITELDVDVLPRTTKPGADYAVDVPVTPQLNPYVDRLPETMQLALAKRYAELFQVFRKHRDVIDRVTFWGVADGDSWLNNWPMKGRTNHPLLFDRYGRAKPALAAIISTTGARLGKQSQWPAELTARGHTPAPNWSSFLSVASRYFSPVFLILNWPCTKSPFRLLLCATFESSVPLWLKNCWKKQPQRHRGQRGCTEKSDFSCKAS